MIFFFNNTLLSDATAAFATVCCAVDGVPTPDLAEEISPTIISYSGAFMKFVMVTILAPGALFLARSTRSWWQTT